MNGNPNRLILATVAVVIAAIAVVVVALNPGAQQHHVKLSNGAPRPAQQAPKVCRTTSGQAVTSRQANGEMGACAPRPPVGARLAPPLQAVGLPHFIDLSNNDPVYGVSRYHTILRNGYLASIDKVNQGNYIDPTYSAMVRDARAAGLKVGGYDFIDTGRVGVFTETNNFINRLKATGTCTGNDVHPPVLDVEYSAPTRGYLQTAVDRVKAACHKVVIYTGQWWWNPHIGCWWPAGVPGWISGYGVSDIHRYLPCGLGSLLKEHQYTSKQYNGTSSSDASIFFGTTAEFNSFTGAAVSNPPTPAERQRCIRLRVLRHLAHPTTGQLQEIKRKVVYMHRHKLSCTSTHLWRLSH